MSPHPARSLSLRLLPLIAVLLAGCSPDQAPATPNTSRASASNPAPAPAPSPSAADAAGSASGPDLIPPEHSVEGYAGSDSCRECHRDEHASWHRGYHRSMTQRPVPGAVLANFNHVVLTNNDTRFTLRQQDNQFLIRMERLGPGTTASPPESVEAPLGLITGSHHMQVFWVGNGMGNCQVGFPFTWLIPEKRWVPRNSTFIRPPDFAHQVETWNLVCARCHATGAEPGLDRAARSWNTRVAELGISCEACHGPGARHVGIARAQRASAPAATPSSPAIDPPPGTNWAIIHPGTLDPARASQICGFCHSMKWMDRNEGWPERGFRYRPGDDLDATTPVMRPRALDRQPWLVAFLKDHPDTLKDFFWPDGMIRVSGREYHGLIDSPCHVDKSFSCLSCHSIHKSDPSDLLARERTDNRACTQCHSSFADPVKLTAHTHHRTDSTGSSCYNCHMPHTTYGVLSAIRSHEISNPRVTDERAHGRPNACNLCHLDRTLSWTAGHLNQWYQQPIPDLDASAASTPNAVRLALAGDAGQRALLTWHLGWEPAARISGSHWLAPVLGRLLDDPYAAIRCLANRSLQKIAPALVPPGYDYADPPESRPSASAEVLARWAQIPAPASVPGGPFRRATGPMTTPEIDAELARLVEGRNNKPVRLRE